VQKLDLGSVNECIDPKLLGKPADVNQDDTPLRMAAFAK
jgi:hypothetical protein